MSRYFFRSVSVAGTCLLLLGELMPAAAVGCCAASGPAPGLVRGPFPHPDDRWTTVPLASWMFKAPAFASGRPRPAASGRQFDYMFERHLWLTGGGRTIPAGLPLTAATSTADRTVYSLAGLGLGYRISPSVRAITNWSTGLGPYSVSPGSQFTVGVALR